MSLFEVLVVIISLFSLILTIAIALITYRIQNKIFNHQSKTDTINLEINRLKVLPIVRFDIEEINEPENFRYKKIVKIRLVVVSEIPIIIHDLYLENLETKEQYRGGEKKCNFPFFYIRGLSNFEIYSKNESIELYNFKLNSITEQSFTEISSFINEFIIVFKYSSVVNNSGEIKPLLSTKSKDFVVISHEIDLKRIAQFL